MTERTAQPRRVLIIDDSPITRDAVQFALEDAGFEVHTASDGDEGLLSAGAITPEVVVCDMRMPGMNGIEVVEAMRQRHPTTPVVILTDQSEVEMAVKAMREGAFGYLLKGMSEVELVQEIQSALTHRRLLERNRQLEEDNSRYQKGLEQLVEAKTREIARLQDMKAHAEKMAAMGTLVAGVAHEVNSPLAVVASNVDFAASLFVDPAVPPPPEDAAELPQVFRETKQCVGRIQRIVDGLRRFAHPEANRERCALGPAVEEAKLVCRERLPAGVEVRWTLEECPEKVGLPHDALVSMLANLVVNAGHALEANAKKAPIDVRLGPDGSAWVRLSVRDEGCGIPREHLSKVCDPFFTTKAPGKGTGLGLSLVHQVLKAAGGELVIESEVGVGTTVTARIPVEPVALTEGAKAHTPPRA